MGITPNVSGPTSGALDAREILDDGVGLGEHLPCLIDDFPTDGRDVQCFVRPFEEDDAEIVFKLLQLSAQRRLTDMTGFGGAAEMAMIGQGNEIAQFAQRHAQNPQGTSAM